jgi:hypothetical protein
VAAAKQIATTAANANNLNPFIRFSSLCSDRHYAVIVFALCFILSDPSNAVGRRGVGNTIQFRGERLARKSCKRVAAQPFSRCRVRREAPNLPTAVSYEHANKGSGLRDQDKELPGGCLRAPAADELMVCPAGRPSFILSQFERE